MGGKSILGKLIYLVFATLVIMVAIFLIVILVDNQLQKEVNFREKATDFCESEGYEKIKGSRISPYCQKLVDGVIIERPIKKLNGEYYWYGEE